MQKSLSYCSSIIIIISWQFNLIASDRQTKGLDSIPSCDQGLSEDWEALNTPLIIYNNKVRCQSTLFSNKKENFILTVPH